MADNPITTPLPADLPTDWVYGQTVGPQGTDVDLTQQHGYNYLMQQVNAAQQAATQIGQAFSGIPSSSDLQNVQNNLNNHINNKENPHGVTASQVSTSEGGNVENSLSQKIDKITILSPPTDLNSVLESGNYRLNGDSSGFTNGPSSGAGWGLMSVVGYSSDTVAQILYQLGNNVWTRVFQDGTTWSAWAKLATLDNNGILSVSQGGTGVPTIAQLAQSLFPSSIGSLNFGYNFAITGPGWADNGYMSFQELMSQIATNGGCRIAAGSYVGNGLSGESNPTVLQFPFKPKYVTIPNIVNSDEALELIEVYNGAGNPILAVDAVPTGSTYSSSGSTISGPLGYYTKYRYDNNTNTLYFYSNSSSGAYHQQNQAGQTYYWIAIG